MTQSELSSSARRVQDALNAHGFDCRVLELPDSTRTAREAAVAIGCEVAQIVKSLVFKGREDDGPLLVVASGVNRVNEKRVARLFGQKISKPDAAYVREKTGYVIGGVPPLGHEMPLPTFIDRDLLQYDEIWAAAGTPRAVFSLTPDILQSITGGTVADIS